jgi:hypothetical protein
MLGFCSGFLLFHAALQNIFEIRVKKTLFSECMMYRICLQFMRGGLYDVLKGFANRGDIFKDLIQFYRVRKFFSALKILHQMFFFFIERDSDNNLMFVLESKLIQTNLYYRPVRLLL